MTYLSAEVSGGVESDVSESLHDEGLSLPSGAESDFVHEALVVEEEVGAVKDSAAGGRHAPVHTSLGNGLSGNAARAVEVSWVQLFLRYK